MSLRSTGIHQPTERSDPEYQIPTSDQPDVFSSEQLSEELLNWHITRADQQPNDAPPDEECWQFWCELMEQVTLPIDVHHVVPGSIQVSQETERAKAQAACHAPRCYLLLATTAATVVIGLALLWATTGELISWPNTRTMTTVAHPGHPQQSVNDTTMSRSLSDIDSNLGTNSPAAVESLADGTSGDSWQSEAAIDASLDWAAVELASLSGSMDLAHDWPVMHRLQMLNEELASTAF